MLKCFSIFASSRIGVALTSPRCRGRQAQRKSIYFLKISLQGTQVWFSTWNDLLWAINNLHNGTPMFLEISLDEHTIYWKKTAAIFLWEKRRNINAWRNRPCKQDFMNTCSCHTERLTLLWCSSPRKKGRQRDERRK